MKDLNRTEEDVMRSLESIFDRMTELALETNTKGKKGKRKKSEMCDTHRTKRQITLLNKSETVYLHIPDVPTTFKKGFK